MKSLSIRCCALSVLLFAAPGLFAVDSDGDGMSDALEISLGYNPNLYTRIIHVDAARPDDSGDGLTPATAKRTIGAAVAISRNVNYENVIMVAPGVYAGAGNRNLDFDGCDIKLRSTDGAATTIIDLDSSGRFLVLENGETLESWLDGFTIRNGLADDGGAVYVDGASLVVKNCVFQNNHGSDYAGAVSINFGSASVIDCRFVGNSSPWGGALAFYRCDDSSVVGCDFVANRAEDYGALVFYDCRYATFHVERCRFVDNQADCDTAGIFVKPFSTTVNIVNCLMRNNFAENYPEIRTESGTCVLNLTNVTIARSRYTDWPLCRFNSGTSAVVVNSIVQGWILPQGSLSASHNCSPQNLNAYGANNLRVDPRLTGAGFLKADSPCIDAGTSSGAPTDDLDGTARPSGAGADIGCHEFTDSDADGMDDVWEIANFGDLSKTASGDEDGDGVSNLDEYHAGTDPNLADTDGDGIDDLAEIIAGTDPLLPLRAIHADASRPDDSGDGLTPATAKRTIAAALALRHAACDNEICLAPGTYSGVGNRDLTVSAQPVRFRGADVESVVIDLQGNGCFLELYAPAVIENLTVRNGDSAFDGGAVYADGVELRCKNCVFENNATDERGGAVFVEYCRAVFENCVFDGNTAVGAGGAVMVWNGDRACFLGCKFTGNAAGGKGGAVATDVNSGGDFEVSKCVFSGNVSGNDGGAFYIIAHGSQTAALCVVNSLFTGNSDTGAKGDLYTDGNTASTIANITIVKGSSAAIACRFNSASAVTLVNSVVHGAITLWGTLDADCNVSPHDLSAYGIGNLAVADPLLDPDGKPLENSPCIDAGTSVGAPPDDLAGTARPQGAAVDIGCYEYVSSFIDTDGDGLPDDWEMFYFGNLDQGAYDDYDGDGVPNIHEYLAGTNPTVFSDADNDGMSDDWEIAYMGGTERDGTGDFDNDGIIDLHEYLQGSRPDKGFVSDTVPGLISLDVYTRLN